MDSVYLIGSLILIGVVLAAVWLDRWSVPVILIALCAGILCGSDVLNLWYFDDISLTKQIANLALVFILFHGGFSTRKSDFQAVALPAGGLATWGVILTAATTFGVLRYLLEWPFEQSILLSVIISSTDAAAIFSILRRQSLPKKLSSITEIESGANDPMAVLLTAAVLGMLTSSDTALPMTVVQFIWKFSAAPLVGWAIGRAGLWLFNRLSPQDRGHYYVLSLGMILLTYGIADALQASGMLAVFVAGYVMGNRPFVHKQGVTNFSAALSTVANIAMFVMLGLQVFPHQWANIWMQGIIVFAVLTFISRPLAVLIGTIGMRLGWKDKTFIAWAGLRGSVPIVLATYPAAAGLAVGQDIFNMVFFAVLLSIAVQGSTLGVLAKWLKLTCPMRPKPLFNLELVTMSKSDFDLIVVDLPDPQDVIGKTIAELQLPAGAVITLITRGKLLIAPKGSTHLHGGDQVTVLAHASEEEAIRSVLLDAVAEEASVEKEELPDQHAGDDGASAAEEMLKAVSGECLMDIRIERVTNRQQVDVLASLAAEIWNEHFPEIIGQEQVDYMLEQFQSIEALESQIDSGYEYYLALHGDDPVGYLSLIPNYVDGKLMISKIYVKGPCRGSGLGGIFLEYSKARAKESGADAICLTVNRNNTPAVEWYRRKGFEVTDEVKKDIGSGFLMDDFVMECTLD
ncbi:potassium/proton antiporter [Pontiella agarivorans]|uniref:Potassium/proton antiporter n=1 Tax=Pontiella agarivorans TaxID=3038953 RepID=A0ABU5MVY3_9BACT|nr:potassium/proton antiporter [Pontiella agarivorans]MDZ8118246.1 potassium/proton antiporter [Pontiella agarivorans]